MSSATKREEDFQTVANKAGRNSLAWIREDVDALNHAQECKADPDTCRFYESSDGKRHRIDKAEDPKRFHDEDEARQHIEEGPLSVKVRGDLTNMEALENAINAIAEVK